MHFRTAPHIWETLAIMTTGLKQATVLESGLLPPAFLWNNVAPSAPTKSSFSDLPHFTCSLFLNAAQCIKNMTARLTLTKHYKTIKLQNKCDYHLNNLQRKHQLFVKHHSPNKMQPNQEIIKSRPCWGGASPFMPALVSPSFLNLNFTWERVHEKVNHDPTIP